MNGYVLPEASSNENTKDKYCNDYYRHLSHLGGGIRNQTLGDPKTIKKFWTLAEINRFLS